MPPQTTIDDDTEDLEDSLEDVSKVQTEVNKQLVNMTSYLRSYVVKLRKGNEGLSELFADPFAREELADLYAALMKELDDEDNWDTQDTLEIAALTLLMTLSLEAASSQTDKD